MRISPRLKRILYISISLLYVTGVSYFIFSNWVRMPSDFGPTTHPSQIWQLRLHSIFGLWFLIFFGYFYARHVQHGLKGQVHLKSGLLLYGTILFLILTVPLLFYLTSEKLKVLAMQAHTYVGLALPFIIAIHVISHVRRMRNRG